MFQTSFVVRLAICGIGWENGSGPATTFLPAGTSSQERPPAGLQKGMAVMVQVLEFGRDVFGEFLAENDTWAEEIPNP
jgi:hypothetical protein